MGEDETDGANDGLESVKADAGLSETASIAAAATPPIKRTAELRIDILSSASAPAAATKPHRI
jgi:hypothetical protein